MDDNYSTAILDPWKGIAFEPITGRDAYLSVPQGPTEEFLIKEPLVREFFENGCIDTSFLIDNDISIVYYQGEINNPDLVEIRDNIYIIG